MWIDIASIVFVCVTANHLGLIEAIESVIRNRLPIINCPKCLTFWSVLGYSCITNATYGTAVMLAISFLCAYLAIWLELLEGYIDTIYTRCYEKIYDTTPDTFTTDANNGDTAGTMS